MLTSEVKMPRGDSIETDSSAEYPVSECRTGENIHRISMRVVDLYSLDDADPLHSMLTNIAAVQFICLAIKDTLERIAKTRRADLGLGYSCTSGEGGNINCDQDVLGGSVHDTQE